MTTLPSPSETTTVARAELIDADEAKDLPTSFGVFKPVGHVMVGLPTPAQAEAAATALQQAGWPRTGVRQFLPSETVAELQAMVENAGVLAGFGSEIHLLRRYLALTAAGYRWLLVKAEDPEHAQRVAEAAQACGATVAVYYRTLMVEELIT